MAKGLKPTGRRTGKFKRYSRKARSTTLMRVPYKAPLTSRHTFPFLPAQLQVKLRLSYTENLQAPAGQNVALVWNPLYTPTSAGQNIFAGGFLDFMRQYSRAQVMAVSCHTRIVSRLPDNINLPVEVTTAVLPATQAAGLPAQEVVYNRVKNLPSSRSHVMGKASSGYSCVTDYRTVDLETFAGTTLTPAQGISRQALIDPIQLTYPSNEEAENLPAQVVMFSLVANANNIFTIYYEFDFSIRFSELTGLTSTLGEAQIAIDWIQRA